MLTISSCDGIFYNYSLSHYCYWPVKCKANVIFFLTKGYFNPMATTNLLPTMIQRILWYSSNSRKLDSAARSLRSSIAVTWTQPTSVVRERKKRRLLRMVRPSSPTVTWCDLEHRVISTGERSWVHLNSLELPSLGAHRVHPSLTQGYHRLTVS